MTRDKPKPRHILRPSLIVGWREWVCLPGLRIDMIKAKIDSGARSSSLHAERIRYEDRGGETWVLFDVFPLQRSSSMVVPCAIPLLEMRDVRSSNGEISTRPIVVTKLSLGGRRWPIELSLAARDQMGFRMLLGREAIRNRVLIDTGKSFLAKPPGDSD